MEATIVKPPLTDFVLRNLKTGENIPVGNVTVIGREDDCQIRLPEGRISRYHAKLTVNTIVMWIEDLNSTNGTYVNGKRLEEQQPLQIGDELSIDKHKFRLASTQSGRAEKIKSKIIF